MALRKVTFPGCEEHFPAPPVLAADGAVLSPGIETMQINAPSLAGVHPASLEMPFL